MCLSTENFQACIVVSYTCCNQLFSFNQFQIINRFLFPFAGSAFGTREQRSCTFDGPIDLRAGTNKIALLSVAVGLPVSTLLVTPTWTLVALLVVHFFFFLFSFSIEWWNPFWIMEDRNHRSSFAQRSRSRTKRFDMAEMVIPGRPKRRSDESGISQRCIICWLGERVISFSKPATVEMAQGKNS